MTRDPLDDLDDVLDDPRVDVVDGWVWCVTCGLVVVRVATVGVAGARTREHLASCP